MENYVVSGKKSVLKSYRHTLYASYLGYITQAIVNNFVPLLFTTFIASYGISLEKITLLVTINFEMCIRDRPIPLLKEIRSLFPIPQATGALKLP